MLKIYVDTNIYMDYFEDRKDNLRPLGEFAFSVLKRAIDCEFVIVISSLVINELEYTGFEDKINSLMSDLKEIYKLIYVEESEKDGEKARQLRNKLKTPSNDTKHAVIAIRLGADCIVTRNVKDFANLQHLIKIRYPENL